MGLNAGMVSPSVDDTPNDVGSTSALPMDMYPASEFGDGSDDLPMARARCVLVLFFFCASLVRRRCASSPES
jgi:hypothetical protein